MQNQHQKQIIDSLIRQHHINKPNSIAIAGFILSLVALFAIWLSIISLITFIFFFVIIIHFIISFSGLVLSIIGMQRPKKGLAVAGLIISIIVILIYLIAAFGASSFLYLFSTRAYS